jgi:hypothetical protein
LSKKNSRCQTRILRRSPPRRLLDAFDRFVAEAQQNPGRKTVSPVLGLTPMQYWTHALGVHLNHHYRQFGLV